jgi:hypothetical protein
VMMMHSKAQQLLILEHLHKVFDVKDELKLEYHYIFLIQSKSKQ